jgi:hypothetical protein
LITYLLTLIEGTIMTRTGIILRDVPQCGYLTITIQGIQALCSILYTLNLAVVYFYLCF